jgi:hypothetical protein
MTPDDTDKMDTIPSPPPTHVETIVFAPLRTVTLGPDDSDMFAFSLDSELLDER